MTNKPEQPDKMVRHAPMAGNFCFQPPEDGFDISKLWKKFKDWMKGKR